MDFTFFSVTIIFIVFLTISYFLDVIKLSTPLLLIYIIFCFTYIVDKDSEDFTYSEKKTIVNENRNKQIVRDSISISMKNEKLTIENNRDISKPIVSLNPKPIVIDTNLIIQNDKEKNNRTLSEPIKALVDTELEVNKEIVHSLKLKEVMICRGVYKRNPIKPGFEFNNNIDSLFCYTKISNSGSKQEIKHLWFYEDKLMTSVSYNIKTSYNYRSWSKKTILPNQIGNWRVEVMDVNENVLGIREFKVTSLDNEF